MRFGIVTFPGSNCDHDAYHVCKHVLGQEASFLWHKDRDLQGCDVELLPGARELLVLLQSRGIRTELRRRIEHLDAVHELHHQEP